MTRHSVDENRKHSSLEVRFWGATLLATGLAAASIGSAIASLLAG